MALEPIAVRPDACVSSPNAPREKWGDCRSACSVNGSGGTAWFGHGSLEQGFEPAGTFGVFDPPADRAAVIDVEDDVAMEAGPFHRSPQYGDVPRADLVGRPGQQFGLLTDRGTTLAAFRDLAPGCKDRGTSCGSSRDRHLRRAGLHRLRPESGGWGLVGEAGGAQMDKHRNRFAFRQGTQCGWSRRSRTGCGPVSAARCCGSRRAACTSQPQTQTAQGAGRPRRTVLRDRSPPSDAPDARTACRRNPAHGWWPDLPATCRSADRTVKQRKPHPLPRAGGKRTARQCCKVQPARQRGHPRASRQVFGRPGTRWAMSYRIRLVKIGTTGYSPRRAELASDITIFRNADAAMGLGQASAAIMSAQARAVRDLHALIAPDGFPGHHPFAGAIRALPPKPLGITDTLGGDQDASRIHPRQDLAEPLALVPCQVPSPGPPGCRNTPRSLRGSSWYGAYRR